jgi:hypothetical protein
MMMNRIIETLIGEDDLERVAARGDLTVLNQYLRKRAVFVPSVLRVKRGDMCKNCAKVLSSETLEPNSIASRGTCCVGQKRRNTESRAPAGAAGANDSFVG